MTAFSAPTELERHFGDGVIEAIVDAALEKGRRSCGSSGGSRRIRWSSG
jgi:hypothetical protein